jgi:hypothetical protein
LKVNFGVKTTDAAGTTSKLNEALKDDGNTFFQVLYVVAPPGGGGWRF